MCVCVCVWQLIEYYADRYRYIVDNIEHQILCGINSSFSFKNTSFYISTLKTASQYPPYYLPAGNMCFKFMNRIYLLWFKLNCIKMVRKFFRIFISVPLSSEIDMFDLLTLFYL